MNDLSTKEKNVINYLKIKRKIDTDLRCLLILTMFSTSLLSTKTFDIAKNVESSTLQRLRS